VGRRAPAQRAGSRRRLRAEISFSAAFFFFFTVPSTASLGGTALVVATALARIMPSQPTETLVPPTRLSASKLEYSVHRPSRLLRRDIELVFRPDLEVRAALCPALRECL